jgi:hypothetical protein
VDAAAPAGGDGSPQAPFNDLAAAVAYGRDLGARVHFQVAPGAYEISETLVLDYPLDLIGSNQYASSTDALPTGIVTPGTETILMPSPGFSWYFAKPMVQVGTKGGPVLSDVTVRNLSFDLVGAPTGDNLNIRWTQGYTVRDNVFRGNPQAPVNVNIAFQSIASSGTFSGNYISNVGLASGIGGGSDAAPAQVRYVGNRVVNNHEGGLFAGGGLGLPESQRLELDVLGNEFSGNKGSPRFSWGVRIFVIYSNDDPDGPTSVPPSKDEGHVIARVRDNRITDNAVGIAIEAGFPNRYAQNGPPVCDLRLFSGTLDVTLTGNTLQTNPDYLPPPFEQIASIVSLTRFTGSLNKAGDQPNWQYLRNSAFSIADPDGTLSGSYIDHARTDSFSGQPGFPACPNDDGAPLGNSLSYNGVARDYAFDVPQNCVQTCAGFLGWAGQGLLASVCPGAPGEASYQQLLACVFTSCASACGNLDQACFACTQQKCGPQLFACLGD